MRNVPPKIIVSEALDTILADLQDTLAGLTRPAELVAAERALLEARERRANAWAAYTDASKKIGKSGGLHAKVEAEALRTKAAVAATEAVVARAQKSVDGLRHAYGAVIAATVERHRAAAAAAVDGASRILAVAADLAKAEHVTLPDMLSYGPEIQGLLDQIGIAARRQRDREHAAFAAGAAAMSARLRAKPPAPTSLLRWKGKLSDLIGEVVDDTPVPARPGSMDTVQRIPASALDRSRLSMPMLSSSTEPRRRR